LSPKTRTSSAQKRTVRFNLKYDWLINPKRNKNLLGSWVNYLTYGLAIYDLLERLVFPVLDSLLIPPEQEPDYVAFAKRLGEILLKFTGTTRDEEMALLEQEFITRGLEESVLNAVEEAVLTWSNIVIEGKPLVSETMICVWAAFPNQTIPGGSFVVVRLDHVEFDQLSEFDTVLYRFRPQVAGFYFLKGKVTWDNIYGGFQSNYLILWKNYDPLVGEFSGTKLDTTTIAPVILTATSQDVSSLAYLTPDDTVCLVVLGNVVPTTYEVKCNTLDLTHFKVFRVA
jgi:hypothetical protein